MTPAYLPAERQLAEERVAATRPEPYTVAVGEGELWRALSNYTPAKASQLFARREAHARYSARVLALRELLQFHARRDSAGARHICPCDLCTLARVELDGYAQAASERRPY